MKIETMRKDSVKIRKTVKLYKTLYFTSQLNKSGPNKYSLNANNLGFTQFHLPRSHLILKKCLFLKMSEWLYVAKVILKKSL